MDIITSKITDQKISKRRLNALIKCTISHAGVIQLQTMAQEMDWSQVKVYIESRRSALEGLLDERSISLGRIENITNTVNFWLASQVESPYRICARIF